MRKLLFIAIAVLGTSFAFGQETLTTGQGRVFNPSDYEIIEIKIPPGVARRAVVIADGSEKIRQILHRSLLSNGRELRTRKVSSWVVFLKKHGYVLTYDSSSLVAQEGTTYGSTVTLVFEKQ